MARVCGGLRQTANFSNQLFPADLECFVYFFSFCQFGDRRAAGHRRNTTFGAKSNIGDALAFCVLTLEAKREFENVSADWILQARAAVGRLNFTSVSRMLEMVQQFSGIHRNDCNSVAREFARNPDSILLRIP
jgi:hypothetical protein